MITEQELAEMEAVAERCEDLSFDEAKREADIIAARMGTAMSERYREAATICVTQGVIIPPLCGGCALRPGSEANTSIDGMGPLADCIMTGVPFYCHEELTAEGGPVRECSGWLTLMGATALGVLCKEMQETAS